MIQFDQWWFPNGETQLPHEMAKHNVRISGRLTWQFHKYVAALSLCPTGRRRCAVDIGAHVGLWSYWMARDFDTLHAFEPNIEAATCWVKNVGGGRDITIHACALGETATTVQLDQESGESGGAHVVIVDHGTIEQRTLDSFTLADVDLIKIDVEGYASAVIAGARETLLRCKPIVIVEEALWTRYGYTAPPGDDLHRLGMTRRTALGPDGIYEWT